MKKIYFLLIALVAIFYNPISAQIIFRESFDYTVGNLQDKNGGVGFSTKWDQTNTDVVTAMAATTTAQIVSGSINSSFGVGNRAQITLETGKSMRIDRTLSAATLNVDAQDYWLGFWYRSTSTQDNTTYGVAAQIILMNGENTSVLTDMRLGFGKTSNFTGGSGVNSMTGFTRANASCQAANWPSTAAAATTLNVTSQNTYYVLVKISRREFVDLNTATLPAQSLGTFDGVRVWFLSQPPSGPGDAIFTSKPAGDITTVDPNTAATLPILARVLRGGADNTAYNTACKKDGITGLRIRLEGASTTPFNVEFDEITLSTTLAALLPATFNSFSAVENGANNVLAFNTSNESNVQAYQIESSSNGSNFSNIGSVKANNSNGLNKYSFTDAAPYTTTYYRIKQVDNDGSFQYSSTVKVDRNNNHVAVSIAPNPVASEFQIRISGNNLNSENTYAITNILGKNMAMGKFVGNRANVNVSALTSGLYYVRIQQADGTTTTSKLYKQ
jgi:hypothetical protein